MIDSSALMFIHVVIDTDHFAYTRHEPIGVCGAIIPVSDVV